jgi:hypothetical protein
MRTTVPSDVCRFIDTEFPALPSRRKELSQVLPLSAPVCGSLRALVYLAEAIPTALLPVRPPDFGAYVSSIEAIKFHVAKAERHNALEQAGMGADIRLVPTPSSDGWNPVMAIRNLLGQCSDSVADVASREFLFIKEPDVRTDLLADLNSIRSALNNLEWKPATVVAGALVEALLLWAVDQSTPAAVQGACATAFSKGVLSTRPVSNPERWGLEEYTAVADELGFLKPTCRDQLKILRPFRNLIHPGNARRTAMECHRGTAHAAYAAVDLLARDLEARFS